MTNLIHSPWLVFLFSFLVMWLSARFGFFLRSRQSELEENAYHDLDLVVAGTLTLLSLIIGFSFSMAVSRYDQRKNYEEEEANAIGTEYLRAELLPADAASRVQALLAKYLDQRILFYQAGLSTRLDTINNTTVQLQTDLWSTVRPVAAVQQTPIIGLVVSGMNDVLNSQGYTQAAWWNRIPFAAWCLMLQIAIFGNILLGYYLEEPLKAPRTRWTLFLILPLILSISFLLIADIDSPRGGFIHVNPQNLVSLSHSLHS